MCMSCPIGVFATLTIREVLQEVGRGQELTLGLAVNLGLSSQRVTMFDFYTRYSVFKQFGGLKNTQHDREVKGFQVFVSQLLVCFWFNCYV